MFTDYQITTIKNKGWKLDGQYPAASKDYRLLFDAILMWAGNLCTASHWSEGSNILRWVWIFGETTDTELLSVLENIDLSIQNSYYAKIVNNPR